MRLNSTSTRTSPWNKKKRFCAKRRLRTRIFKSHLVVCRPYGRASRDRRGGVVKKNNISNNSANNEKKTTPPIVSRSSQPTPPPPPRLVNVEIPISDLVPLTPKGLPAVPCVPVALTRKNDSTDYDGSLLE